jgi:hypothetical protein
LLKVLTPIVIQKHTRSPKKLDSFRAAKLGHMC